VTLDIRPATEVDVDAVVDILAEATAFARSKGMAQWPARFRRETLLGLVASGVLYVAEAGGEVIATITLQWSDPPFWGDRDDAGFVHRVAVTRSHPGVGRALLEWAEGRAVERGRRFLCLDCVAANARLRRYYEGMGFRLVTEAPGPPDHAHTTAHGPWLAALYEKPLRAAPDA
jgi:GNAT superfamily N-acetyltransferase